MIEIYVKDIQNALKNHSYYCALSLALTLPDICGMVEFPNKSVGERYISFYNKYIKKSESNAQDPYSSGEVIYNLRNTYLHQGSPNIDSSKVKEKINQVDKFILSLGKVKCEVAISVIAKNVAFRAISIDIVYLCEILCNGSLLYYRNNKSKFEIENNIDIVSQDPIGDVIVAKLSATGLDVQFKENLTQHLAKSLIKSANKAIPTKTKSKEELQLRTFFGQNFKEKKFKDKKEQIIAAVLKSKTKTQLNMKFTKIFSGEDIKIIFQRLRPLIKDWPGK